MPSPRQILEQIKFQRADYANANKTHTPRRCINRHQLSLRTNCTQAGARWPCHQETGYNQISFESFHLTIKYNSILSILYAIYSCSLPSQRLHSCFDQLSEKRSVVAASDARTSTPEKFSGIFWLSVGWE